MTKVVIIGGVAGGASAAARLRRLKEDHEIIILEKGPYVSFANCGLPYWVGNIIKEQKSLELVSPRRFKSWFNIDVRINNEAISIDRSIKKVLVRDLSIKNEYSLDYDYLLIATGSTPIIPPFQGLEDVPYHTIWTIPDAVKIRKYVEKNKIRKAVIVGGGFIGLEMAENLVEKGVKVKIIEMLDQVMPPIDKEMAQFIHQELILNGVCLVLEDPVELFTTSMDDKPIVKTKNGRQIESDLVIMAVGIKPMSELAKESGLELNPRGNVIVNEYMQTSDPNIYAVGDAVQVLHYQTKNPTSIALAGPANKQGRIAADNIAGREVKYKGILGASVVKIFDITVAAVGLTEKQLKETNINYEKVFVHPNNHAGYYPGATPITIKLLFEVPTGKVLGAQAVGGLGTEKRIDVISTVIKFEGTVFDLEELELTYAPPYSSAKDPVNMAGFVASNYLRGDIAIKQWHDIDEILKNNGILLDVRTTREHEARNIEGSVNIPIHELRDRLTELSKEKPIFVYCEVGYRSYISTRVLLQNGFEEVYELTGGFKLYETATATTEDIVAACGSSEAIMEEYIKEKSTESEEFVVVDCSGLACPGPLNAMIKSLEDLPENKKLKVYATDPGFKSSIEAYSELNEAVELLFLGKEEGKLVTVLKKIHPIAEVMVPAKKKSRAELRGPDAPPISNISIEELYERLETEDEPPLLIDVRTPQEYSSGHIKNTKMIPLGELLNNTDVINEYKDKEIISICHSGSRSMMAAQILARVGFKDIRNLTGGVMLWRRKGYPVLT
ncbi:MAG: FAD-dependent oxidoreductase [Promethearchaeota archaeon]|jgi:NADPH-dependent 2,4-dienoyl-CoA reductase/sulfur reductase-like enzyme/rhodanese-related sulfurtransferase/TusA-related sulfurtransferase